MLSVCLTVSFTANKFADWLEATKLKLTNNRYRLEDQRDLIESKHEEIKKKRAILREIEVSLYICAFFFVICEKNFSLWTLDSRHYSHILTTNVPSGPVSASGERDDIRQQVHDPQNSDPGSTVGPAERVHPEDAPHGNGADRGSEQDWCGRGWAQGVHSHVQTLRQGQVRDVTNYNY